MALRRFANGGFSLAGYGFATPTGNEKATTPKGVKITGTRHTVIDFVAGSVLEMGGTNTLTDTETATDNEASGSALRTSHKTQRRAGKRPSWRSKPCNWAGSDTAAADSTSAVVVSVMDSPVRNGSDTGGDNGHAAVGRNDNADQDQGGVDILQYVSQPASTLFRHRSVRLRKDTETYLRQDDAEDDLADIRQSMFGGEAGVVALPSLSTHSSDSGMDDDCGSVSSVSSQQSWSTTGSQRWTPNTSPGSTPPASRKASCKATATANTRTNTNTSTDAAITTAPAHGEQHRRACAAIEAEQQQHLMFGPLAGHMLARQGLEIIDRVEPWHSGQIYLAKYTVRAAPAPSTFTPRSSKVEGQGDHQDLEDRQDQEDKPTRVRMRQTTCQLKVLHSGGGIDEAHELVYEAEIMAGLDHKNILKLVGVAIATRPWMTAFEHCRAGKLSAFLKKCRTREMGLHPVQQCYLADQIAEGMEYLHGNHTIHMNLAAQNILLDKDCGVKIAEFRVAQVLQPGQQHITLTRAKYLLWRWMAPEAMTVSTFSYASDAWAYATVTWEIFTGGLQPYSTTPRSGIIPQLLRGARLHQPKDCPDVFYRKIMQPCWHENPTKRPTFAQIRQSMVHIMGTVSSLKGSSFEWGTAHSG